MYSTGRTAICRRYTRRDTARAVRPPERSEPDIATTDNLAFVNQAAFDSPGLPLASAIQNVGSCTHRFLGHEYLASVWEAARVIQILILHSRYGIARIKIVNALLPHAHKRTGS
jgi:hypothetical protein